MTSMTIAIPTMKRIEQQHTWGAVRIVWPDVVLACPEDEAKEHRKRGREVLDVPMNIKGIAATRQFIMENIRSPKVLMMDDDLTFSKRRTDDPSKFSPCTKNDTQLMLHEVSSLLEEYPHASISIREGAHRHTERLLHAVRVARVVGFRRDVFFEENTDFRNNTVMDDFEAVLHLLSRGRLNAVLNSYVQNQRGSGTEGGASTYRTMEMQAHAAELLRAKYPDFVRLVTKKTKVAWGGAERTDVIVQWKKAYAAGALK